MFETGWTDGLPVVPPTASRVKQFVDYTGRDPAEIIAELPPLGGKATVERIAVNAVMAGCLPEYLPVVITALQAMMDDQFNQSNKYECGLPWSAPAWLRSKPRIPGTNTQPVLLPLKIIWPGFIVNTLLYAMLPFLLFSMKFKMRGYIRFIRKQCIKCGYPIGQSEVCTECGTQLILKRPRL